jgi:membrane protein
VGVAELKRRVRELVAAARARSPLVDHGARALEHYSAVFGSQLAAAVTYFAFLSFFPLVALCFALVGYVVSYVPGADEAVTRTLNSVLPGMVGTGPDQIDIRAIARARAGVGFVGLVVLLYSGLGWVSALRTSLQAVFGAEPEQRRGFVVGKVYDLVALIVLGVIMLASVGLGATATGFTGSVLEFLGLTGVPGARLLVIAVALLIGLSANLVVFFVLYRLLPRHTVPTRDVWKGALVAAVGFEVLKLAASLVIGSVTGNPLYGAFAIIVALLVWINYVDRLAVFGAAWAATASPRSPDDAASDDSAAGDVNPGLGSAP